MAPFADAAFSMKEGEIRGPVKTQFGYHILKLDGIQPASVKTFEQSKSDLEAEYRRNEAERLFNNAQDQLADAALQNTTDIDVVARKAGLTVHEIPDFSRSDGGGDLGKSPAVIEAAFSPDVLDGRLSPIVEVEKGRGVVLRATDHKLPQQKPLEAVRTEVVAAWKKQRGTELAAAAAAEAVKRLTAGESWDGDGQGSGCDGAAAEVRGAGGSGGSGGNSPPRVRRAEAPGQSRFIRACRSPTGDTAVIAVSAVREDPSGDAERAGGADAARVCASSRPRSRRRAMRRRRGRTPR